MGYERLLVATDLSDASLDAARLGAQLAEPSARWDVVYVLPTPNAPLLSRAGPAGLLREDDARRAAELERSLVAWARSAGLPQVRARVREGVVAIEVGQLAREVDADLIVVGARGTTRFERVLLGSTARPILREAPCDVLLARDTTGIPPRRILVATDFHPPSRASGKIALALARAHGAKLDAIHAVDPSAWGMAGYPDVPGDAEKTLEQVVVRLSEEYARDVLDGEGRVHATYERAHVAIAARAKEWDADLVVVGTHGARALERLLIGSVAEAVAERSPCSVLVVRARA